ncbi:MAG: hypothetical protein V4686_00065 [Patescibacteria group bacterium]
MIAFTQLLHFFENEVMEERLSMSGATTAIQNWMKDNAKPWWELEKLYPDWVISLQNSELVKNAKLYIPSKETLWRKDPWHEDDVVPFLEASGNAEMLGKLVHLHLEERKLLRLTPSLEDLEYYEKDEPKHRWKVWDRVGLWVFAWKAACKNKHGHVYVKGIRFDPKTGKSECKWVALKNIYKHPFKVLLRKENT